MSWSAPTSAAVLTEFTAKENDILQRIQGADDPLPGILARVVAEIRDAIRSGGYALDSDETTLPLGLHTAAIDLARWRFLISSPKLEQLQTEARSKAADRANTKLEQIAAQKYAVEPPDGISSDRAGTWNSENKLIMRTHPTPRPNAQFPYRPGDYANSDAPEDAS